MQRCRSCAEEMVLMVVVERSAEVQELHRCRGAEVVLERWSSWWCLRDGAQLVERSAEVQEVQTCRDAVQMCRCPDVHWCRNAPMVQMCRCVDKQRCRS